MPQQLYAYGGMILVIAVITLLYYWKSTPARQAADRFGLLFLEARDYAMNGWRSTPEYDERPDGGICLRPAAEQPQPARNAMERGRDPTFARYDKELESALRDLFQALGSSGALKRRYYDYYNNVYLLHKNFSNICFQPEPVCLSRDEWDDLATYTGDRGRIIQILAQRLSDKARRQLLEQRTNSGTSPCEKEGIG